jgi:hypothetical protein
MINNDDVLTLTHRLLSLSTFLFPSSHGVLSLRELSISIISCERKGWTGGGQLQRPRSRPLMRSPRIHPMLTQIALMVMGAGNTIWNVVLVLNMDAYIVPRMEYVCQNQSCKPALLTLLT